MIAISFISLSCKFVIVRIYDIVAILLAAYASVDCELPLFATAEGIFQPLARCFLGATLPYYGYGIEGKAGTHTSTTTTDNSYYDYANYYNYMNYMNNYYGYGYGGMYNSGYYGYNLYYYGYTPPTTGTTTTTTTTSAEIQSYAPLLFQVFVEK